MFSPNAGKYEPEKTAYLDNFQAVSCFDAMITKIGKLHRTLLIKKLNRKPFSCELYKNFKNIFRTLVLSPPFFKNKVVAIPPNPKQALRKKCPYLEFFWSVFSRIRTEYGEVLRVSPYSVRMQRNTDQNNSENGHFSRSEDH